MGAVGLACREVEQSGILCGLRVMYVQELLGYMSVWVWCVGCR